MTDFAAADRYLEAQLDASLDELTRFARIPSIAAQGTGLEECAELAAEMLRRRGFEVAIHSTPGSPVVTAEP